MEIYVGVIEIKSPKKEKFFNFKKERTLSSQKNRSGFSFDLESTNKLELKEKDRLEKFSEFGTKVLLKTIKDTNAVVNNFEDGQYFRIDYGDCELMEVTKEIENGKYYKVKTVQDKEVIINAEGKEVLVKNGTAYEFGKDVTFDEAIHCIKEQMNVRGYQCEEHILESFYLGLQTDQLLLLTGRPGTGKSSFVTTFADVFGIDSKMIAVQSNWTDKCELLGYYNALENSYISTPFLDALIEFTEKVKQEQDKEKNKNKLYFICLDEMNLSHIEYYFADFLSALQGNREIELYSKRFKDNFENELNSLGLGNEDLKSFEKLQTKLKKLNLDTPEERVFYREWFMNYAKCLKC